MTIKRFLSCVFLILPTLCFADGKILATPGVSQIEGSGGGGIVPWAQLAGYASEDEIAASAFCSVANVKNFSLNVCGAQANLYDRVELSIAQQQFDVDPLNVTLKQDIYGAKFRLYGDLIYSNWPQFSLGLQHKRLKTADIAFALGAKEKQGTDIYLAASKLHLGAIAGYNFLWNATFRYTQANEMGLLGFGGKNSAAIFPELSAAILLSKHIAIGIEYRKKPDNLGLNESHWRDMFIAWFPNKHINLTAAYLDLDTIAGIGNQQGFYFSLSGQF
ncbi:DUF3034 family protein [Colwellia sp. RSH04]|uniref:DUF3034 family protein n=1 Tax=Colwellia sp. RSH04 TaxID=2305464 RepID=UPI000E58590A|nr:DUF3034 family protein [Colwellia sp. RSH04]RHW75094.1 DUF3034 family protein [Colwellia sp. RSH04]